MTKKTLYALWAALYILCAGLGFIPGFSATVSPVAQSALTALALLFFLPPAWLLVLAARQQDTETLRRMRNLSALSLGLTLLVLVCGLAFAMAGDTVGIFFHVLLILVSSPMVCGGYWVVSLFLWACLLMVSLSTLRKHNKRKG